MIREGVLYEPWEMGRTRCNVCAQYCKIAPGHMGVCRTRENRGGKIYTLIYNTVASTAVDPIEKKPFYHFYPGTDIFSMSSVSCSYRCAHCHNAFLSFARPQADTGGHLEARVPERVAREEGANRVPTREIVPEEAVALAMQRSAAGMAWTYNEPTIWLEYAHDCALLAKRQGLYTAFVTNGTFTEESQAYMTPVLDAANVDVKAFTDTFYRRICGGRLEPVLRTCERIRREGKIHLEVTYLIIPAQNDDPRELRDFCHWAASSLGPETPVHFSRFYPYGWTPVDYPTPLAALDRAYREARRAGLHYIYVGNVRGDGRESTHCPDCRTLLIQRSGYRTRRLFRGNRCPSCGRRIPLVDYDSPRETGGLAPREPVKLAAG
ncbi:MAG: radical SAM protein [Euryarchaeota archaeon]|nr:radical SAM protein [Euryarchaeota archaeon]